MFASRHPGDDLEAMDAACCDHALGSLGTSTDSVQRAPIAARELRLRCAAPTRQYQRLRWTGTKPKVPGIGNLGSLVMEVFEEAL